MENNDFSLYYKNNFYQNQMNQLNNVNRTLSPKREDKINQSNANVGVENYQNGNYYTNQFPYFATPKKNINICEPDTLLSPLDSNFKNDIFINQNLLLTNKKPLINNMNNITPFKTIMNNSPYNGMISENKR